MTDMADIRAVYLQSLEDCRIINEKIGVLQNENATLTAERDEARHTIRLLCDLIANHPNPALTELMDDILDPKERG